ncbi:DUF1707 SHOCT-like domain-containing protein [Conexibacter woesei]|uniref:Uncharacterized protein n=1 Tax=Conexibacter woesei (strain DSM 14684 / CCUG 47730 / CIP 108061 / JCM 11494 / NBRC 100937 / ID131577) TaxID=469383 RepID=D3FBZ6_CONWI|nr:DUF1707 domain-containing protein [Conexibacter woesei]ADB51411.1 protein of unknown function DUF1707 [Conexibacter woesei DSM 14684]
MTDPGIRASDGEREETIERLRAAAGEGRLTLEELTDRIETASGASTRGQLDELTGDLPAFGDPGGQVVTTVPARNSALFGDHKRDGQWQLPAVSRWDSIFGDVKLDLREARVPAGEIVIDVRTFFGDVELLVPEGVLVEVRAKAFLGDVKQDAGMAGPAGAPRIVLTGTTVFGDVRVRARRLRERLAARLRRAAQ